MQLRDRKEIFTQLKVGSAIVKLAERHTSPFLVEVPFTELREENFCDEKIKSKMEATVTGFEVEKSDPEFLEKISSEPKTQKVFEKTQIKSENTPKEVVVISELTKTQKILLEFVKKKFSEGKGLNEIERLLDSGLVSGFYSKKDVLIVVNTILSEKLNKNKTSQKEVQKSLSVSSFENLNSDELNFVNFLLENLQNNLSTTQIYKKVGFSPRKGNVIKEKLLKKGIIFVKEERNTKGWKKLIRLSNSYSNN